MGEERKCTSNSSIECDCIEGEERCKDLEQYRVLVFCDAVDCVNNKRVEGKMTVIKNANYTPFPGEHVKGVCTRGVLKLSPTEIKTLDLKHKLVKCSTYAPGSSGHMDFSRLLKSDGTPHGGSIDSTTWQTGAEGYSFSPGTVDGDKGFH